MKVTLNKLIKIRNRLQAILAHPEVTYTARTDEDLSEVHKKKSEEFAKEFSSFIEGRFIMMQIRDIISGANHENKIDHIISEIAMTEDVLRTIKEVYSTGQKIEDVVSTVKHNDLMVEKGHAPASPQRVRILVIDREDQEGWYAKGKKALQNRVEDLKEERNALNHKTLVELPTDVVEYLKGIDLI